MTTMTTDTEVTSGLYRVRDKNWTAVWGENLTISEAIKLKEKVCAERKSTTARVEPMSVKDPRSPVTKMTDADVIAYCGDSAERWAEAFMARGATFDQDTLRTWFANAIETACDKRMAKNRAPMVDPGVEVLPIDRQLEQMRSPALAAAASAAAAANERQKGRVRLPGMIPASGELAEDMLASLEGQLEKLTPEEMKELEDAGWLDTTKSPEAT